MMSEYKIDVVKRGEQVRLRGRKRIPYDDIIKLLLQGEDIFIEVDRKMAYYIKRKINQKIKDLGLDGLVDAIPAIRSTENGDVSGYIFRLVMWRGDDKVFIEKEKLLREIDKMIDTAYEAIVKIG